MADDSSALAPRETVHMTQEHQRAMDRAIRQTFKVLPDPVPPEMVALAKFFNLVIQYQNAKDDAFVRYVIQAYRECGLVDSASGLTDLGKAALALAAQE